MAATCSSLGRWQVDEQAALFHCSGHEAAPGHPASSAHTCVVLPLALLTCTRGAPALCLAGAGGGVGGVSEAVWLFPGAPSRQERPQQRLLITAERARPPLPTPSNRRRAGNRNCHPVTKIAIQEGWEWRQEEPGVCQGLPEQWNQHQYHLPPGFLLSEKKKKGSFVVDDVHWVCCNLPPRSFLIYKLMYWPTEEI